MLLLSWLSKYKNSSQTVRQNHSGDVASSEASTSHTALPTVNNIPTGNIEADVCSGSSADCDSISEQHDCDFLVAPSVSKSVIIDNPALQHQCLLFHSCHHQPKLTSFPKRSYGKTQRSFISAWYGKYKWLHYQEHNDYVLCYYCTTAKNQGLLKGSNKDDAFTMTGYSQWKKALERFEKHQNSDAHHEAVDILITIPSSTKDVGEMLSSIHAQEKEVNRKMLPTWLVTFSCSLPRYLRRQGLALHDRYKSQEDAGQKEELDSN